MKLVRYGIPGEEKPGLIDGDGALRDLSSHVADISGSMLDDASLERLRAIDVSSLPKVEGEARLGVPVSGIGKYMCIGLNYRDHAEEAGMPIPEHPILFMKANSAISGPDDPVSIPRGSTSSDWEIELGAVIGTTAKYVSPTEALKHVAGYCICNDVSERHFQIHLSGNWTKGKSCDTFGPHGSLAGHEGRDSRSPVP